MWPTIISSLATTACGTLLGWLFGRRRQNIDNIDAAVETWQKIVDALQAQIERLLQQRESDAQKIDALTREITLQVNQIETLKVKVENLENEVAKKERIEELLKRYERIMSSAGISY
jgi:peptidoglycan hydrolase CwlO-like protein